MYIYINIYMCVCVCVCTHTCRFFKIPKEVASTFFRQLETQAFNNPHELLEEVYMYICVYVCVTV